MNGHLYILCGPSSSGKTTLLNYLCKETISNTFNVIQAPKYSTRKARDTSDDLIQLFDSNSQPLISICTGPFYDEKGKKVELGSSGIDIAYVINDESYGLSTSKIEDLLSKNKIVLIIISDFRIIRQLKQKFQNNSSAIYLASAIDESKLEIQQTKRLGGIPEEKQLELTEQINKIKAAQNLQLWDRVAESIVFLNDFWKKIKPGGEKTEIRAERIRTFHTRYIDQLTLFDHVILNYTIGEPIKMRQQMINIIKDSSNHSEFHKNKMYPPIFIVAAASGSGKGIMMEKLRLMANDKVKITSKIAKRKRKENDMKDLILIGKPGDPPEEWPEWPKWWSEDMINCAMSGQFPAEYDIRWVFHKHLGDQSQQNEQLASKGVEYAVSSLEIDDNINSGFPQIFVSNMEQFDRFKDIYGNRVVFLYLHRLATEKDMEKYYTWYFSVNPIKGDAQARIQEIRTVYQSYIDHIVEFDRVLLNTSHKEDLYDQIFNLLEYYNKNGAVL